MKISDRLEDAGRTLRSNFDGVEPPPIRSRLRPWSRGLTAAAAVIALGVPIIWLTGRILDGAAVDLPPGASTPEQHGSDTTSQAPGASTTTETIVTSPQALRPVRVDLSDDGAWTIYELAALDPRDGMSAAMTAEDLLFLWGGFRKHAGITYNDGALVDLATGLVTAVPPAPLDPRMNATAVWTGSEFVVFGGQNFDRGFSDGAAFDPETMAWRRLPDAPLSAASHPTAVFADGAMYVWLPSGDTPYAGLPAASAGQFARYRPGPNSWDALPAPPASGHTARLVDADGTPVLVIGPQMLAYGTPSTGDQAITVVAFDARTDVWGSPVTSDHKSDAAAAFVVDSAVRVLLVDGRTISFSNGAWTETAAIDPICPLSVHAAAGPDTAYLTLCGGLYVEEGGTIRTLSLPGSLSPPEQPLILCCGGVLQVMADGSLVIVGWEGPAGTGETFRVNLLVMYVAN